jgi:hypothetical protein
VTFTYFLLYNTIAINVLIRYRRSDRVDCKMTENRKKIERVQIQEDFDFDDDEEFQKQLAEATSDTIDTSMTDEEYARKLQQEINAEVPTSSNPSNLSYPPTIVQHPPQLQTLPFTNLNNQLQEHTPHLPQVFITKIILTARLNFRSGRAAFRRFRH